MSNLKLRLRNAHAGLDPVDLVRWCREALADIERLEGRLGSVQQCAPLLKEQARRLRAAVMNRNRYANAAGDLIDLEALAGDLEDVRKRSLGEDS